MKTKIQTVTEKPTANMPVGVYKVISSTGLFWGFWEVVVTWTGERTVISFPGYLV